MKLLEWKHIKKTIISLKFLNSLIVKPQLKADYSNGSKYNKFVYVYYGNGVYRLENGETINVTPGMLIYTPMGERFIAQWEENSRLCFLDFIIEEAESGRLATIYDKPTIVFEDTPNNIAELFTRVGRNYPFEKRGTALRAQKYFFDILYELSIFLNEPWIKEGNNRKLSRAFGYIRAHFTEDFSIEQLAEYSGYSPSRLRTAIKKQTGKTPIEIRNQMRIDKACEYLATTEMNIGEIAVKVGYRDTFYFSNYFKKCIGISPSKYRRQSGL